MGTKSPNTTLLDAAHATVSDKTPAALSGPANLLRFVTDGVQPPTRVYVQRDDKLYISLMSSFAGITVVVNYRVLQPNGQITSQQQQIVIATAYTPQTALFDIGEGLLLSLSATCGTAGQRGICFMRTGVARNGLLLINAAATLFADYIAQGSPAGWPDGRVLDPTESTGFIKNITVGNPAAGADFTSTVPTQAKWIVRHFSALLTTSAAAGARNARLFIDFGVAPVLELIPSQADQAASLATQYSIGAAAVAGSAAALANTWAATSPLVMLGTYRIGTSTAGILAGDQWSNIRITVEEWLVGV